MGATPGETTIRSGLKSSIAICCSVSFPIAEGIPSTSMMSKISAEAESATTSTLAPSS